MECAGTLKPVGKRQWSFHSISTESEEKQDLVWWAVGVGDLQEKLLMLKLTSALLSVQAQGRVVFPHPPVVRHSHVTHSHQWAMGKNDLFPFQAEAFNCWYKTLWCPLYALATGKVGRVRRGRPLMVGPLGAWVPERPCRRPPAEPGQTSCTGEKETVCQATEIWGLFYYSTPDWGKIYFKIKERENRQISHEKEFHVIYIDTVLNEVEYNTRLLKCGLCKDFLPKRGAWKVWKSDFTVGKSNKHYLSHMSKVNINSDELW